MGDLNVLHVMKINLLTDCKSYFKRNFIDSYIGYTPIILFFVYKIFVKYPGRIFLKNNQTVPMKYFNKNIIVRVKPVIKMSDNINIDEDIKKLELKFKHIPSFSFLQNYFNRKENSVKNSDKNELENEDCLSVKLAGIDYINKEGIYFIRKLINKKKGKFYLKFNHILYNDKTEIYCWLLYKNPSMMRSFSDININILLAKNGYGKICNSKTSDIYDETIYYYLSDLYDAELDAKMRGVGIWRDTRSTLVAEQASWKGVLNNFFKSTSSYMNRSQWQRKILKK